MRKIGLILLLCLSLLGSVLCKDEFYKTLGVKKSATDAEIKKAYRSLAKKWHPDRHKDDKKKEAAEKKFMKISEAYETLTDPEKRKLYDEIGDDYEKYQNGGQSHPGRQQGSGPRFNFQQGGPGGFSGYQNFGHFHNTAGNDGFTDDIFSAFASMFGGGSAGARQPRGSSGFGGRSRKPTMPDHTSSQIDENLKASFAHSDISILKGNEVKETLGNSFRGNEIWIALLVTKPISDQDKIANSIIAQAEKFKGAFHFAAVNRLAEENQKFCSKFLADKTVNAPVYAKVFSPYDDKELSAYPLSSSKSISPLLKQIINILPSPKFSSNADDQNLSKQIKTCLKSKDSSLGCVLFFSDKMNAESAVNWKLKAVAHKLKQRAEIIIVHTSKLTSELKQIGVKTLPSVAVYKNTALNRAEVDLNFLKIHALDGSSFSYLSDTITREIWRS